jgi:hypothetical protein
VYHGANTAAPETDNLQLAISNPTEDSAVIWNDTAPTSSVFSVGSHLTVNGDGNAMLAYLWSEKQGFSKFGSYVGNGSTDGPFLWCGFRPAWFMTKRTDSSGDWRIRDIAREPHQPLDAPFYANTAIVENDGDNDWDIVSNGLKMRGSGTGENADGGTYIFMAFAEQPFVNSNGVPCTAR